MDFSYCDSKVSFCKSSHNVLWPIDNMNKNWNENEGLVGMKLITLFSTCKQDISDSYCSNYIQIHKHSNRTIRKI